MSCYLFSWGPFRFVQSQLSIEVLVALPFPSCQLMLWVRCAMCSQAQLPIDALWLAVLFCKSCGWIWSSVFSSYGKFFPTFYNFLLVLEVTVSRFCHYFCMWWRGDYSVPSLCLPFLIFQRGDESWWSEALHCVVGEFLSSPVHRRENFK